MVINFKTTVQVGKGLRLWKKTCMDEYGLIEMSCFGDSQSYSTKRVQRMGSEWGDARVRAVS